jgi:acetoin utilization deacetylase AcuC-like enzyme
VPFHYSDVFPIPLPENHRYPRAKSRRLRERLQACGEFDPAEFRVAEAASDEQIRRVHCEGYLRRVTEGALDRSEVRAIGLPWSPALVERSRRASGASVCAAREALVRGWAANLAGGSHHAFRDHGQGYCVFNDAAIAARAMQAEAGLTRIAIVDCDVHQGNGSAAIFAGDDSVFTFSIHASANFPSRKETSDLDIGLADGARDDEYLWHLERALDETLERSRPQLVFYLAGADPFEDDTLGRLGLTKAGLARRDRLVLETLRARSIPVALSMAGGYARDIEDSVDIHVRTLLIAAETFRV